MAWVRLDDQFAEHPKMQAAGPLGRDLQVSALCYANRNLTDGYIPRATARRLADIDDLPVTAQDVIDRLVQVGAWIKVAGGYRIHDYTDYQPTKEQVLAEREQKQAAGRKGGLAAASKRRSRTTASATADATAPAQADAQAERVAESKQKRSPVPVPTASKEAVTPPTPPAHDTTDEPSTALGGSATPPTQLPTRAQRVLDRIIGETPPDVGPTLRAGLNGHHHTAITQALDRGWQPHQLVTELTAALASARHPPGALLHRIRALPPPPAGGDVYDSDAHMNRLNQEAADPAVAEHHLADIKRQLASKEDRR